MRELPPDLAHLGAYLEAATQRELQRRNRRRAALHATMTALIAAPMALGFWAAPLADSQAPLRAAPIELSLQPPTNRFTVRHIPDKPVAPDPSAHPAERWPAPPERWNV